MLLVTVVGAIAAGPAGERSEQLGRCRTLPGLARQRRLALEVVHSLEVGSLREHGRARVRLVEEASVRDAERAGTTTELDTEVLVGNGQTVVLGGVFRNEEIISETKTPFLGDVPYIGRLFRKDVTKTTKTETLIFITPRILSDRLLD